MSDKVFKAPYLTYNLIRKYAEDFLERYHHERTIHVPIEEIVEFKLNIGITPLPGLKERIEIEGFISSNLKTIYVDQGVMEKYPNRYRFTLAHEVGHAILHEDLYKNVDFESVEDWKHFIKCLDPREYGFFELHAYNFAGLVLVPTERLEEGIKEALRSFNLKATIQEI